MRRFNNFRNKGIKLTNRQQHSSYGSIRKNLDQILKSDYEGLRTYRSKNILECGVCSSNTLIMEYIRTIYQQYNLWDPMEQDQQQIFDDTPIKIVERRMSLNKDEFPTHKHTRFSHKRHASGFFQQHSTPAKDSDQIKSIGRIVNTAATEKPSSSFLFNSNHPPPRSLVNSESAFKHTRVTPFSPINSQYYRESQLLPFNHSTMFHHQNTSRINDSKIKDSYRFCIACEKPILEANIIFHQTQCLQFQKLYSMDIESILHYLQMRIQNVQRSLKETSTQINRQDADIFKKNIEDILETSETIARTGRASSKFSESYQNAIEVGDKWGKTNQQIAKLRWFVRMRQHIKTHFGF